MRNYDNCIRVLNEIEDDTKNLFMKFTEFAFIFNIKCEYEIAKEYLEEALELDDVKKSLVLTSATYHNLGDVCSRLGDFKTSMNYYEKCINHQIEEIGENSEVVAMSYCNIGLLHSKMENFIEAIEFCEKAYKICKNLLGEYHGKTSTMLNNLGSVYLLKRDYQMAHKIFKKALDIELTIRGPTHISVGTLYTNLSGICSFLNDPENCKIYKEKAEKISNQIFGEKHINNVRLFNSQGNMYLEQGKYQLAVVELLKAYDINVDLVGKDLYTNLALLQNLGYAYLKLKEYKMTEKYYKLFMECMEKNKNEETKEESIVAFFNITQLYLSMEEPHMAIKTFHLLYEICVKKYGEFHHKSAAILSHLGKYYIFTDNLEKALFYAEKSLDCYLNCVGEVLDVYPVYNLISSIYNRKRTNKEGIPYKRQDLKIIVKEYGWYHYEAFLKLLELGGMYFEVKEYNNAVKYLDLVVWLITRKERTNEIDAIMVGVLHMLGVIYAFQMNDRAIGYYQKGYRMYMTFLMKNYEFKKNEEFIIHGTCCLQFLEKLMKAYFATNNNRQFRNLGGSGMIKK